MRFALLNWRSLLSLRGRKIRKAMFRQRLRACVGRFYFERLEGRRMLASISDGGSTTLNIDLAANESLSIVSNGSSYVFSSNQTFNNAGVVAASDFSSFGSAALTLQSSGLARYDALNITDFAAGARLTFGDSGSSNYFDNFIVLLNSGSNGGVQFVGNSAFSLTNRLQVNSDANITINKGASLTSVDGGVTLSSNTGIALNGVVTSNRGDVNMIADADANGTGILSLAPEVMGSWLERSTLTSSSGRSDDYFGISTAISADGNTAIVGAYYDDVGSVVDQGSATIFTRTATGWIEQQQLVAAIGAPEDHFGWQVALSADGNTAIVGADYDDVGSNGDQGSATIFVRSGTVWTQQQQLIALDGAAEDHFGASVALSSDGNTAFVGAISDDIGANTNQGSVSVFVRNSGVWTQQQKLTLTGGLANEIFGRCIALSADGQTLMISQYSVGVGTSLGSVAVFGLISGNWTQQARFAALDTAVNDAFGSAVALSADGNTAIVGAFFDNIGSDPNHRGTATVFVRTNGTWTQQQQLRDPTGADLDNFGSQVSINADGNVIMVGISGDDIGSNTDQGSVLVFARSGTSWSVQQRLTASGGAANDRFGEVTLSADGKTAFVGAWRDSVSFSAQGSVREFQLIPRDPGGQIVSQGNVRLAGAEFDVAGSIAATGTVSIEPTQAGRTINLGTKVAGVLALTTSEFARISADTIRIGNDQNGALDVTAEISRSAKTNLILTSGTKITVSQAIESRGGSISLLAKNGIALDNSISSSGGNVTLQTDMDADGLGKLSIGSATNNWIQRSGINGTQRGGNLGAAISISADGNTAIVGSPQFGISTGEGIARVLVRSGSSWNQEQVLLPVGSLQSATQFGASVALSADGNTAIIGCPSEAVNNRLSAGTARVFVRVNGVWTEQQKLSLPNALDNDRFGTSVAISADGNTAMVGSVQNLSTGSVTAFVRSNGAWTLQQRLTPSVAGSSSWFTNVAISADGNTAIIGSPFDGSSGSATFFQRSGTLWTEQRRFRRTSEEVNARFGSSVTISADGNTAAVGAPRTFDSERGFVSIFSRIDGEWVESQRIDSPTTITGERFGASVALSVDAKVLLIGASTDDVGTAIDQGSAFLYGLGNSGWTLMQKLVAVGTTNGDQFGSAVAISGDSKTIMVGAPKDDVAFLSDDEGSVWLFKREVPGGDISSFNGTIGLTGGDFDIAGPIRSNTQVSIANSLAGEPVFLGGVGGGVSLSESELNQVTAPNFVIGNSQTGPITINGKIARETSANLTLTTPRKINVMNPVNWYGDARLLANDGIEVNDSFHASGAVELRTDQNLDAAGNLVLSSDSMNALIQRSKLKNRVGKPDQLLGSSVAVSADGKTAIVAAQSEMVGGNLHQGSATVFSRVGYEWIEQQRLFAINGEAGDFFGSSVDISDDGNTVIVGALQDNVGAVVDQGSATVFVRSGGIWTAQQILTASDGSAGDLFGCSVALSGDGSLAVVGAIRDDVGTIADQGSVTVFARTGTVWVQQQQLTDPVGAREDFFGLSVDISADGSTLITGSSLDDIASNADQGSASIFTRANGNWSLQAKLTSASGAASDGFGRDVALSSDGNIAVVAAPRATVGGLSNIGSATLFRKSGSIWAQDQVLYSPDVVQGGDFGFGLSVNANASVVVVGASSDLVGTSRQGSATVFKNVSGSWTRTRLTDSDGKEGDFFGIALAINADGSQILISSYEDIGSFRNQGAVQSFQYGNAGAISSVSSIDVLAPDVEIQGSLASTGSVSIASELAERPISLGTNVSGSINLTDAELDRIDALTINIGRSNSGAITVSQPVTRPNATNVNLTTGPNKQINFVDAGSIDSAGGNIQVSTSGTGAIVSGSSTVDLVARNGSVILNAGSGGIGGNANPLLLSAATLGATTTSNGNIYLGSLGNVTIGSVGLDAGTGTIELDQGTFSLGASNQINDASKLSVIGATFSIGSHNDTVNALLLDTGAIQGTTGILNSVATIQTRSGFVSAILAGANGLNQTGNGNTTLAGVNTYSGATTISVGTLILMGPTSNNFPSSSPIEVRSGAILDTTRLPNSLSLSIGQTLKGSGTVVGNTTATNRSTISPGNGPGVLNTGNVVLMNGSTLTIELNGRNDSLFDQLNVTGSVDLSGATLDLALNFTPNIGDTFKIINNDGTDLVTGAFLGLEEGEVITLVTNAVTRRYQLSYLGGDGNDVVLAAVDSALKVTINPNSISEKDGIATGTVTRFGDNLTLPLTVTLTSNDTTEAVVPTTVVIPANATSTTFPVTAVDDTLRDGAQLALITASATGYSSGMKTIQVTDHELLTVTLSAQSISENGGTANGTVTRSNTDIQLPLVVSLTSSDVSEATVPASVTIPANQTSITFVVTALDDTILDGTQVVQITASSPEYFNGAQAIDITDFETLSISITAASIAENGDSTVGTVTRNNTDIALPLTVTLTSSDLTEASVPATVTIPANQSSVSFVITAVDDNLLDGTQRVILTGSAPGYISGAKSLDVTDVELISLTMDNSPISENGGTKIGTVTRGNTDIGLPITVFLSSSDTTEAVVPATVIIPANQSSTNFTINAVKDNLLDGTQSVTITATSPGYQSATKSFNVTDAETFIIAFDSESIIESGGSTSGTVSRTNTDISLSLVVVLASNDLTEATVPATVTIPANQASVSFTVLAVDDSLLDGPQIVTISAAAAGYLNGNQTLTVTDSESLTIALDSGSIGENGGTATGTVTRNNTDISQPLTVTLSSNDLSEATVPAIVTIPANQASTRFIVTAVDDSLLDGSQVVTIAALAPGYISGSRTLTVTDAETVSVTIDKSSISEFGGTAIGTVTRSNTDIALPIVVNLVTSDPTEISIPATVTIPANQASATFVVTAVDDSLLDGTQTATIETTSADYFGSSTSINITDYETLVVTFDKSSIAENGETALATVTRSNTDRTAAVTVTISNSDVSEVAMPTTIIIPSNQASVSFVITAVDDTLLDGTQSVTLSVSATGYVSGSKFIDVTDVELLSLTIDKSRISENGGAATGTVVRGNSDIGLPITVNLTSSDTTEATVPATVTIAANQSSATFTITGMTDNLLDGTQSVAIIAGSPGYFSDLESIDVSDAETVSVNVDTSSISERGGTATGTVTRSNTDIAQSLVVTLTSNDPSEATVPASVTIPAGQASTTFAVTAVDDNLLDGNQVVTITASAARYLSSSNTITITDFETLAIVINAASISENGGATTGRVTRSNTDTAVPLVITLASNDNSEATVPTAVIIPANQSFVTFVIAGVDDSLLDGSQLVMLSAAAAGYVGASESLQVTDSESLSLAINRGEISESGGSAIGTVTRSNTDNSQPLSVSLSSNLASEATVPATITIPAGAASTTFQITAIDDRVLDGTKTIVITASAAGYFDGSRTIDVIDSVFLSLDFTTSSISENGGIASATVTRSNTNINSPLTVQLLSSDATEATVPVTVTIPANQSSATFTVTAVDDTLLDGTQTVSITANAAGYIGDNRYLVVTDAEFLTISINPSSISENGGTTTGTVTRSNSDTAQPLIVALISADTSEADVPGTVTIPANQSSATFLIRAVDDTLLDGKQTVVITGSAAGYSEGTQSIDVSDSESLSVSIDSASVSELGGLATGTVTRGNTDINQPLIVTLQSNDTSEATVPVTVTIPADQASATFAITAVDDSLLDGSQVVSLSASAIGYSSGSQTIDIADFETVSIAFSMSTISEYGGTTTATITRSNTNTSQPITVALLSSDSTEATVPLTVVIPANQSSATFIVSSVDDSLLDGTQSISVVASSPGYVSGNQELFVSDAETLAVTLDATSISENGGVTTGTVTRGNTDIASPLTVTLTNNDTSEANVPLTITIPANQSSTHFVVTGMDDTLLDGSQLITIQATSPGYIEGSRSLTVLDAEFLAISISVGSMSESGGTATGTLTRSNTDISLPLVVTLASDDISEAAVPTTVTIAANQSSATFIISSVDDTLLDGTRVVTLIATAAGYSSATSALDVTDAESLAFSINSSTISESGGSTTASITRSNSDINLPLTINLENTDASEASIPSTITIPANQASAVFTITAVDDDLLDGLQTAIITAGAVGYASAESRIDVTDAESISLMINVPSISERGGNAIGIVTRSNTDIELPLTVNLQSSDLTEASVPTSVTIPANGSSITFAISAVDDALLDGPQAVSIQVSAANYAGSTAGLSVTDSESLTLTIDVGSISEKNGIAVGKVSRSNTDTTQALVVLLVSDATSEAIVPASVTIPINQSDVTFSINSVNDNLIDGNQSVHLTATAIDYEGGTASLIVRDDDPNFPWQNPRNRFDVNNDTLVSPVDALLVINALNVRLELTPELPNPFIPVRYVDVSGDGILSPIDALLVINELNRMRANGEGEMSEFAISSGSLYFSLNANSSWVLDSTSSKNKGTMFNLKQINESEIHPKDIYAQFTDEENAFSKTNIQVAMYLHGNNELVSRSQAKRLMNRIESFQTVILDFEGVESIGHAPADEVFRVYANSHPGTDDPRFDW